MIFLIHYKDQKKRPKLCWPKLFLKTVHLPCIAALCALTFVSDCTVRRVQKALQLILNSVFYICVQNISQKCTKNFEVLNIHEKVVRVEIWDEMC